MADEKQTAPPVQDPDLDPPEDGGRPSVIDELLASQPARRPALSTRLAALVARIRGVDPPQERGSLLPCVVITDHEDVFKDDPQGDKAADAYIEALARSIRENVLPVPRGLNVTYIDEHHNVIELTRNRK